MSIFFDSLARLIVSLKKIIARENFFFSTFCDYVSSNRRSSLILPLGSARNSHSDGMEDEGRLLRGREAFSSARLARRRVISNE